MPASTTFGDYIREQRKACGLSLRAACTDLGISASYLSRLEANLAPPPSGPKLKRLAEVYEADVHRMIELAKDRGHQVMAEDSDVAPAIRAFYRLAQDKTPEIQRKMLEGALDAL
ncbi:unnamed protein product, partial [Ectocarpus fasciculatus]